MITSREIREKIIREYTWIKKVVESAQTLEHLEGCRKLTKNWTSTISQSIRDYRCPFYKTSDIRKTIEYYRRSTDEINRMIAKSEVEIGYRGSGK